MGAERSWGPGAGGRMELTVKMGGSRFRPAASARVGAERRTERERDVRARGCRARGGAWTMVNARRARRTAGLLHTPSFSC